MSNIAERISRLRESLNASQKKLAEAAGSNQSSIDRYENGWEEAPYSILLLY